jgi:predicted RNA binding protein YcfA (HicA-like mRNA interferase family)
VPVHRSETIGRGLFAQILRDCEIAFEDLWKR